MDSQIPLFSDTAAQEFVYSPISDDKVRWYYFKAPYTIKGLLETPSITHRGTLTRFCDSDNATLENSYRQRSEDLERTWWEEEAEFAKYNPKSLPPDPPSRSIWADFNFQVTGEFAGVPVKSGNYEVDLETRIMRPCYWPDKNRRVLRATWFAEKTLADYVPLKECLSECLENGYKSAIWLPKKGLLQPQPDGTSAARLDLTSVDKTGYYAMFYSDTEAYLIRDSSLAWLNRLGASSFTAPTRLRLRRGYEPPTNKTLLEKEADLKQEVFDNDAAQRPVTQLILVVHGIGQTLAIADISQDALSIEAGLQNVRQEHLKGGGDPVERIAVLPVQWRKTVDLEADAIAAQLMPHGIESLRQILHSTAVEVLMYLSPLHRADILLSFVGSLNSAYAKFMLRNPDFKGPVHILAHSLGSILSWDVLTNQPVASSSKSSSQHHHPSPRLNVETLFDGDLPLPPSGAAAATSPTSTANKSTSNDTTPANTQIQGLLEENKRLKAEIALLKLQRQPASSKAVTDPNLTKNALEAFVDSPAMQALLSGAGSAVPVDIPPLHFAVDTLILLGSPLGCFLSLRGVSQVKGCGLGTTQSEPLMRTHPLHSAHALPAVKRLYNLWHPYDPVAYRLEPLAFPPSILETLRTAFVPLAGGGGRRIHIAAAELTDDFGSAASKFGSVLRNTFTRSAAVGRSASSSALASEGGNIVDDTAAAPMDAEPCKPLASVPTSPQKTPPVVQLPNNAPSPTKKLVKEEEVPVHPSLATITGGLVIKHARSSTGRLDFALQEGTLESQYLAAIGAHFSYWKSDEVAQFVYKAVLKMDVLSGIAAANAAVVSAAPTENRADLPVRNISLDGQAQPELKLV